MWELKKEGHARAPFRLRAFLPRFACRLVADTRGAIAVAFALALPVIVGFVAIGVEIGTWYVANRNLQAAADAAAIAAGYRLKVGAGQAVLDSTALAAAAANGYTGGAANMTVTSPPASGAYSGNTSAVMVTVTRNINTLFSKMYQGNSVTANASAAALVQSGGEACVLALSGAASGAVATQGSANVAMTGCSVMANSTDASAVSVGGSSIMSVDCVSTSGGVSGSPTMNACGSANTGVAALPDPYASITFPNPATCEVSGNYNTNNGSLAGLDVNGDGIVKVCGNLQMKGNFTLDDDKTYIIDGSFSVNGGAVSTATGVTFIARDDVTINGGAVLDWTAPSSDREFVGQTGMILIQDPSVPNASNNKVQLNGGSTTELTGAIYVPNNDVTFTGGNALGGGCTQIVANTVTFTGNADISNNCGAVGTPAITLPGGIALVM